MYEIRITIKSFNFLFIKKFILELKAILKSLEMTKELHSSKLIPFPGKKKKYTVLTSPHIDKKSREQFEWNRKKAQFRLQSLSLSKMELIVFMLQNLEFLTSNGIEIEFILIYPTFLQWVDN